MAEARAVRSREPIAAIRREALATPTATCDSPELTVQCCISCLLQRAASVLSRGARSLLWCTRIGFRARKQYPWRAIHRIEIFDMSAAPTPTLEQLRVLAAVAD